MRRMRGLPKQVKGALEKARDSALLAVEIYNKPAIKFKSGGYITLMVIAWTALFHATYFRRSRKPFYKKQNGRYEKIEGDYRYWELDECLKQYYVNDTMNPVRKNLEFFIPLRNKIEHRSMPELDATIFGECQAMLLNFDDFLEKEFGPKYRIRESLSFSLQIFPDLKNLADAVKRSPETKAAMDFIQQFRSTISPELAASGKFSFKAFLIQVANHESQNALAIQFVHYDKLTNEQKERIAPLIAMVKFKEVPVSNFEVLKISEVVSKVQQGLGNPRVQITDMRSKSKFTTYTHYLCWNKYKVRPKSGSSDPYQTNSKYCIYDKRHNDYGYTQAWVDFLIEKLKIQAEFNSLLSRHEKAVIEGT